MDILVPFFNKKYNQEKLIGKILKDKIFDGVYPGYNMPKGVYCEAINGANGWNLFINKDLDETIVTHVLQYIVKNKKEILFVLRTTIEREIYFKLQK